METPAFPLTQQVEGDGLGDVMFLMGISYGRGKYSMPCMGERSKLPLLLVVRLLYGRSIIVSSFTLR